MLEIRLQDANNDGSTLVFASCQSLHSSGVVWIDVSPHANTVELLVTFDSTAQSISTSSIGAGFRASVVTSLLAQTNAIMDTPCVSTLYVTGAIWIASCAECKSS